MIVRGRPPLAIVVVAALGVAVVAVPIAGLLWRAPWSNMGAQLSDPSVRGALLLSLVVSVVAAIVAVVLGVPVAWVLARTRFPGRNLVRAIVVVPLVLPPVVSGVALLTAFGRNGLAGQWLDRAFGLVLPFSILGAVLAAVFISLPFVVITVEAGLRNLDTGFEAAAATLGASRRRTFWTVTLPMILPAIGAGALLAWARALGEFGATITFAGSVSGRTRTLPIAIYLALQESPAAAIAVSIVLLTVSVVVLVVLRDRWFPVRDRDVAVRRRGNETAGEAS